MPNILVRIPKDSFPGEHRQELVRKINEAACAAEQIPDDPGKRALCWVVVDEVESGSWTSGSIDMTAKILPCLVMVYLPVGVLEDASRATMVELIHDAFAKSQPSNDKRHLATSVVLHEVADGEWGVNGNVWRLPDFARASGYGHLQSLVA